MNIFSHIAFGGKLAIEMRVFTGETRGANFLDDNQAAVVFLWGVVPVLGSCGLSADVVGKATKARRKIK
ncbi:hypothetical protein [Timonella sp. A28]|uniref:hypothetical protein n=1 Tax=Timonella sp. A28 TaxID=3442640 RepID=UPI003EC0B935